MIGDGRYLCIDCKERKLWEEMTNKKKQITPNLICNDCIERRRAKTLPVQEVSAATAAAKRVISGIESRNE